MVGVFVPFQNDAAQAQPTLKQMMESEALQKTDVVEKEMEKGIPRDEYNRGTPQSTVKAFFQAVETRNFERAAQHLDLRNLSDSVATLPEEELARQLKVILSRTFWVDIEALSNAPEGHLEDGLPSYRDLVGKIKTQERTYDVLLQKVPRGDGEFIWKFSNKTVEQIPQLYLLFGHGMLDEIFPHWVFDVKILKIYVWEWVAMALIVGASYLLLLAVLNPIAMLLRKRDTALTTELVKYFHGPLHLLGWLLLSRYLFLELNPSVVAESAVQAGTLVLIVFIWTVMRIIEFSTGRILKGVKYTSIGVKVFINPIGNALKTILIVAALIFWLDNLGFEVTTLLTGLGIGGIALALAAQKTLENFIGAITLFTSQPVKVGDFCRFDDRYGTVEEIGLRSTTLRTNDSTLIVIPNGEFSSKPIENYSSREHMWYHPKIHLRYETTPDQLRFILVEIRKMFYSHPKVSPKPARIRFSEFGDYSLNLDVFAFVDARNQDEYSRIEEDLHFRIMDIVTEAGSQFAFPSQTLYLQRQQGFDQKRGQEVEERVRGWRAEKSLFMPEFPQKKIEKLKGSLTYPPLGSPDSPAYP